jgi:hypothetical protein
LPLNGSTQADFRLRRLDQIRIDRCVHALAGMLDQPRFLEDERGLNKLTRTFAIQVEALKNHRSKGEQRMTVQHVHVADGGRAIVGNVTASAEGEGRRKRLEDQPHARGYAPGVEMQRHVEAEREKVPITGS